jgi:hypothetical protein
MIGVIGLCTTGGPPVRIGEIADIMSLFSRHSSANILRLFPVTDLSKLGKRTIEVLSDGISESRWLLSPLL